MKPEQKLRASIHSKAFRPGLLEEELVIKDTIWREDPCCTSDDLKDP